VTPVAIGPAAPADMDVIEALLEREHLPVDGLHQHEQHFFAARIGNRIVGCASIELYGDAALLRSVAVDAEYRGGGVGSGLTRTALDFARRRNVSTVFLLTETAQHFFPRVGFEVIDRADVVPAVGASVEFARACPASATVMRTILAAG
jgi:amino-acid N-acetyltransferase